MLKILVTTDFSDKSKAGLRFAIQLTTQHKFQLIFYHTYNISIPSLWSILREGDFEKAEEKEIKDRLIKFVAKIYKGMKMVQKNTKSVIQSAALPQSAIMEYAAEHNCSYICLSTHGAGKLERLLGTNTANLINFSKVPVIAVPYNYKTSAISMILYASDFRNMENEMKKVLAFARPLKAKVELLHFTSPLETIVDAKVMALAVKKSSKYDIKLNIKSRNPVETLVEDLETAIKSTRPSMVIMFTEQHRDLFQRIFLSSKSAAYSFHAKVPLLVFNKS